jgi:hypothetical protein
MSGNEDPKNKDVTEDAHGASPTQTPTPDAPGGGAYLLLTFIVGLALSMVVGWVVFPKLLYSKKNQPFDFSHKLNLE